jgi:hypothetical protein
VTGDLASPLGAVIVRNASTAIIEKRLSRVKAKSTTGCGLAPTDTIMLLFSELQEQAFGATGCFGP